MRELKVSNLVPRELLRTRDREAAEATAEPHAGRAADGEGCGVHRAAANDRRG